MLQFLQNDWKLLLVNRGRGPSVSVYLPNADAPARDSMIANLFTELEYRLKEASVGSKIKKIIIDDFKRKSESVVRDLGATHNGVSFFYSVNFSAFCLLDAPVKPLVVVSRSFHIKPLIPKAPDSFRTLLERDYLHAQMTSLGTHTLRDILGYSRQGRVRKLIVAADEWIWRDLEAFEKNQRWISTQQSVDPGADDVLDDLVERVAVEGGDVFTADRKNLPGEHLAIAFLRPQRNRPASAVLVIDPVAVVRLKQASQLAA